ncbi:MAG TPA: M48 family metallopeptidase [Bacteroidales bacterium]|nr:M48 family metallopeptidase [Bacteroidales bacterium]
MFNILFWIIIAIIVLSHLTGLFLDFLNIRMWSSKVPDRLTGLVDQEKYSKSQEYFRVTTNFGNVSSTVNLIAILLILFLSGFAWVDSLARSVTESQILVTLLFFAIIGLASNCLSLPFSWYGTFVIEEKFGFNRTTSATFIFDQLKGLFLWIILGIPVIALITWIFYETGKYFWVYVWIVITAFSVFMNIFYANLIVPLFNKQKPLEEGKLRDEIEILAISTGFKLSNIYTINGSKRSTKANAYFSGLGPKKRIVLYDTLIEDLTTEEIVGVLAHEIGHYRKKHSLLMLASGIVQTGLMLYIFSIFSNNRMLTEALGASESSFHISLLAFVLVYSPISLILSLFMNYISRHNEFSADRYAGDVYEGKHLASALKKLSLKNLSNLNPHPAFVFFYYSHPPLLNRLENLE